MIIHLLIGAISMPAFVRCVKVSDDGFLDFITGGQQTCGYQNKYANRIDLTK
jgi:hypothetical protein